MSNPLSLAARGLTLKAGRQILLQPLELSFCAGEFVGILGPSGCGKSTLLRSLAGLQALSGGEVRVQGKPLRELGADERRRIGFVPQDDVVHGMLKVERSLRYAGRLLGLEGAELQRRVDSVMELLELQERRKVRTDRLSGGQRKRVSIAVELLAEPLLLFLDEPTAGLDPALEESFMQNCRQLSRGGRTLLMSTHVMQTLDLMDLILVLVKGYLVFLGRPQEALGYFGVSHLSQMYKILAQLDPATAAERYRGSPHHQQFIAARNC